MTPDTHQDIPDNIVPADGNIRHRMRGDLMALAAELSAQADAQAFVGHLVEHVVAAVPFVQVALLWLFDRQQGILRVVACHGALPQTPREGVLQVRYRPGEGLPGVTLRRGEPLFVEGRTRYRSITGMVHQQNQTVLQQFLDGMPQHTAALLIPFRSGHEVLGILELLDTQRQPPLQHDDIPDLDAFARLAAGTLKQIQLQGQMQADQRRLEVFSAISAAVSTAGDLDELVSNVLDVILNVVDSPVGALFLYNPARSMLMLGTQRELPDDFLEQHREFSIAGSMCEDSVRYGQPLSRPLLPNTTEDLLIAHGFTSCMYLPLLAGGTVTGVVCVYGKTALYSRVDIRSLMLMGSLIGFAIANVLLYQMSDIERRRLMTVINSIAEGVVLCGRDGRLVMANQTAMALLSLDTTPHMRSLGDVFDFYDARELNDVPVAAHRLPIARTLAGEVFQDYRVLMESTEHTEVVMSFSGMPVYSDNEHTIEGAVVVFRDVTVAQKLERAKDDFLAVAAHELRSPLAAVRSYTDLLVRREQRRSEEDSVEIYGLRVLAQQVSHMLRLVDNLLDVSHLDADQFSLDVQPVDLVALVRQVIEQQRPSAGERTLTWDSTLPLLMAVCDQMRIHQVLTNLVSNAVRYSPAHTDISVSIDVRRAEELPELYHSFERNANLDTSTSFAVIAVIDQGDGIVPEQRSRLFQRYARGQNRRSEGLGLGLYLSREFVLRHGGAIWLESIAQQGSTFYVALPLQQP